MSITERLAELGVTLPDAPAPAANYVPFVQVGDIVYVSGQISSGPDGMLTGKLGDDMEVDAGAAAAKACAISLLAQVKALSVEKDSDLEKLLFDEKYGWRIERALEFTVEAFEWNCPQYITPRYSEDEVRLIARKMGARIAELEAELAELKANNTY